VLLFSTMTARTVAVALLVAAGLGANQLASAPQTAESPTFHAAVAPILRTKCMPCHQEDGDGPFPLETFDQVRRRASLIVQLTASGDMPPWKPSPDSAAFLGDRRLTPEQKALIKQWVQAGMPEGVPDQAPAPPERTSAGWVSGPPDLIISLPDYVLPAGPADVFRNFVVAVPFDGTRYVRTFQFRPRTRAVHHANLRVDPTPASEQLDLADPAPGYEGVILHSAEYPAGHFLGWTPGQAAPPADQLAWPLVGRTFFVVQLHMRSTGREEHVSPLLGLYFADAPPSKQPTIIRLGRQNLNIRAGDKRFRTVDSFVTPVPVTVMAIQPHSHYRAREVSLIAQRPDEWRHTLLHISDWDFNWQDQYRLAEHFRLPAGTTLQSVFRFDNSNENPRNPSHPAEDVTWGWRTSDEMADIWVQVLTDTDEDRRRLTQLARQKATAEDAIGAEVLVAREPNHFNLRNDAALIYQELRQPQKALEHFAAARRLRPEAPSTAFNVGIALEALGRLTEAVAAYRDAIAIDVNYVPARVRIAALRYRLGAIHDALAEYGYALQLTPRNAAIRCEFARVLVEANRGSQALQEYRTALEADPRSVPCLINFTWLLASHNDAAIRRPPLAVELGQRAVDLSLGQDTEVLALDALAAAFAGAERFDQAVETAGRALALLADERQRKAIRERLLLYRRRLPFRVINDPPQ
jgi:tetratricopeptide (TPR) repeat protein